MKENWKNVNDNGITTRYALNSLYFYLTEGCNLR
jgi:hypothetical protein